MNPIYYINNRKTEIREALSLYPIAFAITAIALVGALYLVYNTQRLSNSLENRVEGAFVLPDPKAKIGFLDYLYPNEGSPEGITPHLHSMNPGVIAAVGTFRVFFDALLCDPQKFQGIVGRDFNPRVKVVLDFETMLLRISANREDYCKLSSKLEASEKIEERIQIIQEKLKKSNIPKRAKTYYLETLKTNDFASVYFELNREWRDSKYFEKVHYHKKDDLFKILQNYAKSGKIVATVGSINELQFLKKVSLVDVSNVPDYSLIDLQIGDNSRPLIVWTSQHHKKTTYDSCQYVPITDDQRKEINQLFSEFEESKVIKDFYLCKDSSLPLKGQSFSIETLNLLKKYKKEHMLYVKSIGWVHLKRTTLSHLTLEQCQALSRHPEISRFVEELIYLWIFVPPEKYFAFSEVPGWKKAFQNFLLENNSAFNSFLKAIPNEQKYLLPAEFIAKTSREDTPPPIEIWF